MEKKEINVVLGERVRRERLKQKITREKSAETINISARFMADVEAGSVGVSLSTLRSICRVFGVSADYLLSITPDFDLSPERVLLRDRMAELDDVFVPGITMLISETAEMQKNIKQNQ